MALDADVDAVICFGFSLTGVNGSRGVSLLFFVVKLSKILSESVFNYIFLSLI